jgi:hypothetical protein
MNFVLNEEFCSSVESHRPLLNILDDLTRVEIRSPTVMSLPFNDNDSSQSCNHLPIASTSDPIPKTLETATLVAYISTLPDKRVQTLEVLNSDSFIANFHPILRANDTQTSGPLS